MNSFIEFIREQGVVGLAVGFILGGAISKLVSALITDIVNPIISIILGSVGSMKDAYLLVGTTKILWGDFLNTFMDFIVISLIIYFSVKKLKLDRLDKKKL